MELQRYPKAIIPWALTALGLVTLVYPKVTGVPLFPVLSYEHLSQYPIWEIPLIYVASYATRAWGAFVFAFMLGGIFTAFVPKTTMMKYLGSEKRGSYIFAGACAPIFAVCSCAMIPIFGGLLMAGAGIGPALTFLLMAPAANVMAVIFTIDLISWKVAVARLVFSFLGAVSIGWILAKTTWAQAVEERYQKVGLAEVAEQLTFDEKSWKSLNKAFFLFKSVMPILLVGVAAVSYIEAYLPYEVVTRYLTGVTGVLLGAVIGVPLYTPTLVEVFLVKSLKNLGMAAPAAVAFLIGAPMASIPSMLGVSRLIGWKTVISYAVLAIVSATIAGLVYLAAGFGF